LYGGVGGCGSVWGPEGAMASAHGMGESRGQGGFERREAGAAGWVGRNPR